jgi:histone-lysine N-methyltransferase SETD2
MEEDDHAVKRMGKIKLEDGNGNGNGATLELSASVAIPVPGDAGYQSPAASLDSAKSRSQSTEAPGQAKPPRLSRKLSQKPPMREPPLFGHLPDVTPDSCSTFQVIPDCLYGSKHLGATDNDAFDCDCRDEWRTWIFL